MTQGKVAPIKPQSKTRPSILRSHWNQTKNQPKQHPTVAQQDIKPEWETVGGAGSAEQFSHQHEPWKLIKTNDDVIGSIYSSSGWLVLGRSWKCLPRPRQKKYKSRKRDTYIRWQNKGNWFFAKLNAMTLGFCARRVVFTVSDPTYIHNLAGTLEMLWHLGKERFLNNSSRHWHPQTFL